MLKVGSTSFTCNASSAGALLYSDTTTNGLKACVKTATSPDTYGWLSFAGINSDPCAGKTAGQACEGTTAVYLGTSRWMTTPSNAPGGTYMDALSYCQDLTFGGFTGWVLPGITLLTTMYTYRVALGMASGTFWSSTIDSTPAYFHEFVPMYQNAYLGFSGGSDRIYNFHAFRCVRSY